MQDRNPIWSEKYRPTTINDTILPVNLKKMFTSIRDSKNIPNLLLCGPAGCGKTTTAKALLDEIKADYIMINGSLDRNIDILRGEIMAFASSMSLTGSRKVVIIDEADGLNPQSTQPALRAFMEEFSRNCSFILTCNYKAKIIEPLHSRCSLIEFNIPSVNTSEGGKIAAKMHSRLCHILEQENVKHDQKTVAHLVAKFFPDFRKLINEAQKNFNTYGELTSSVLSVQINHPIDDLVGILKEKDFKTMRNWVSQNASLDAVQLYREFYDRAYDFVQPSDVPNLVMLIGEYQYKQAFVADPEINIAMFLTNVMAEISFK